jgi:hypothetical protein
MVQIPKPMFWLRLGFSGETLLCLANIIHTSTECPFGLFHRLRTLKFLSNPCGPSPCDGLSPSPTTMAAPTPFHHINYSLSSPLRGGWLGLPRSLSNPLRRSLGFSCTPVRCRLTSSSSSAGLYLVSHCRFASVDRLFTVFHATIQLPDDFHPISIVSRMLTLWALLTEISCVTLLRLRLAVWGS